MRQSVLTIGGCLLVVVSACAARPECKCASAPVSASAAAPPPASAAAPPLSDADVLIGLDKALVDRVPRPQPNQFETPESVLQFVFQKIASRDIAGALVAFPVIEYYERVTLKDHVKYVGSFSPGQYPLDDDLHGRLSRALTSYLAQYRTVAVEILTDKNGSVVPAPEKEGDMQAFLREFDGARLKVLQVVAIKDTHPESPPKVSSIDEAMGVTSKVMREATIKLENRQVVVIAVLGRIAGNWRVLNMFI